MCAFTFNSDNGCSKVSDLMKNMKALENHFNVEEACPVMAMLEPSGNIIGSVPEETRGGDTQEIDVMMNFGGIKPEFLEKTNICNTHQTGKARPNILW